MPRPVLTLAVTAVAVAALAALRSRSEAPAPALKPAPAAEGESRAPLDAAWYTPTRSRTTAARASSSRTTYASVGAPGGTDNGDAEASNAPKAVARANRPARAPRTTGTPDEFLADSLFRQLDEDGDGVLRGREVPAALRAAIGPKGALTPDTFAPLFLEAVERLRVERIARATPAWFAELDRDGEGRVSRDRWEKAGRDADEFRRIDADGDGFASQAEVVAFVTRPALVGGTAELPGARPPRSSSASGTATDTSNAPGAATVGEAKPRSKADTLFDHYTATAASQPAPARRTAVVTVAAPKKPAAAAVPAPTPPPPPAPAPAAKPKPPTVPRSTLPEPIAGPARWDQRNAENLAMLAAGVKPDVLFLGDSITDGLGFGSGKPLWDELYAPLTAANFGIGGLTTSNVLWQVETGQVALAAPKTIVLLIGSNNLGAKQPPGEVFLGVEKIVNAIGVQLPDTKIMLVGILPRGHNNTDPFRVSIPETNRLLADLDDGDRVTFLDVGKVFLSLDKSISPVVMPDGAHPSLFGYQLYTREIWPTLADLLPKR